mgnify:FL=1
MYKGKVYMCRACETPPVPALFQETSRTVERSAMPGGRKRPRASRASRVSPSPVDPNAEGQLGDEGDSSVSDGGTHTRRRYAPPAGPQCDAHTMEPSGPGSLVMMHEPPEPGGYTMGHPFNQIVFSQFENLDFKDEWVRTYDFRGGTPPQKYVFSRDPNDGLHEDDLYGILNVEQTCPQTAVKKAFTTQSRKWHPDKCDPAVAESAAMRTRWIIAAYKILSDVEARAFWDRRLARIARERRPVEPIAPKRRPRMRGSAAAASAATATVTPLQREAERLAAARSRTDQANRAIAVYGRSREGSSNQ